MKITIVGTGYVGLVTGTCFSETGNHVTCVDIDENKVNKLKAGQVPIYEPGLEKLFERNLADHRLTFTTRLEESVRSADVIFMALPTPPGEDGSADLSYILNVARQIGPYIDKYKVIVNKSTVPVGTAEKVRKAISKNATARFDVVSNPEFLREGVAVNDFMKPERVIIGTRSAKAREVMSILYEPFVRQGNPVLFMDERSAELTKYAANSFLATKISFMNEIANICEKLGADIDMVRKGIGTDSRIGKRFLFAGIGYGGSCFPKDVQALVRSSADVNYHFKILESVMSVNLKQKTALIPKIQSYYDGDLKGKHFALWGLAFKPNTDDIREAPSLYMINALLQAGAKVTAFDPEAMDNVKRVLGDAIEYADNEYTCMENADALIIATEWSSFRTPDFEKIKALLTDQVIFDGRNLFSLDVMERMGFHYESVGREKVERAAQIETGNVEVEDFSVKLN